MDAARFDTLARQLAVPASRRRALRGAITATLLGALGASRTAPDAVAAQRTACTLAFTAIVRIGPNVSQAMTSDAQPGEIRGDVSFTLSESGNLRDGELRLADGTVYPVVGQATGHSLQMRFLLGPELSLVAIGVGEEEISACQGAIDGLSTGPSLGDLGDWHATAQQGQRNAAQQGGSAEQPPIQPAPSPTPTPAPSAACGAGLTRCGNVCVDLRSDLNNCGACGAVCQSGLVPVECRNGLCERANCPVGITYCGAVDGCRDLASDPAHCGACQNRCPGGSCTGGVCSDGTTTCPPGQTRCSEGCVDTSTNFFNCGACDRQCDDDETCQGGICTPATPQCAAGLTLCGGVCVDLSNDDLNCGACGTNCESLGANLFCQGGICSPPTCPAGTTDCGGYCADLMTSTVHCGACGNACPAGQPCQGGVCLAAPACATGLTNCGGVCVDLASDPNNCGSCGVGCVSGICQAATCSPPAGPPTCADQGLTDCNGVCVDLLTDASNCGACGVVCPQGPGFCIGGFCPA